MAFDAKVLRILIASPSDVVDERNLARSLIFDWNDLYATHEKVVLLPVLWETHVRCDMGDRPQSIINKQLADECDALIAMFESRIGTPTGKAISGTVEEIELFGERKKPRAVFFLPQTAQEKNSDPEQRRALQQYKDQCRQNGVIGPIDTSDLEKDLRTQIVRLAQKLAGVAPAPGFLPAPTTPGQILICKAEGVWGWGRPFAGGP